MVILYLKAGFVKSWLNCKHRLVKKSKKQTIKQQPLTTDWLYMEFRIKGIVYFIISHKPVLNILYISTIYNEYLFFRELLGQHLPVFLCSQPSEVEGNGNME